MLKDPLVWLVALTGFVVGAVAACVSLVAVGAVR